MYQNKLCYMLILFSGLVGYAFAAVQLDALDPARVAPHIYENMLENTHVRVLKVTERNGETAPLHEHPETLIVYLSPCAWMEEESAGLFRMLSFKLGELVWRSPITHGGDTSKVIQECSRLEIEMK